MLPGRDPRSDPERSHALQGARAIAACAVVLLHAGLYSASFRPGMATGAFVRHFDSAVPLFLVLSGFLLYSPFAAAHAAGHQAPPLARFALRRAARILPAYWVVLTATALVFALFDVASITQSAPDSVGQGTKWYGLVAIWFGGDDRYDRPVAQSWTLDVEASFYVLLPLVAAFIGARVAAGRPWLRTELRTLGAVLLAVWVYKLFALRGGEHFSAYLFGLPPGYFDAFVIGMGLAVLTAHADAGGTLPAWTRTVLGAPLLWSLWVLLLALGTFAERADANSPDLYVRNAVYVGLAVLPIVPVILGGPGTGAARRLLAAPPLQLLGRVSYGIYLWHFFVFDLARRAGFGPTGDTAAYLGWALVGLVGSTALAALSWRLVEAPMIALARRRAAPTA